MDISKQDFLNASAELHIPPAQAEAFWERLEKASLPPASTPLAQYLYYLGALLVISTMTWFLNTSWEALGGGGIFLVAIAYAFIFASLGTFLWYKKGLTTPGGLLVTAAVCMTPLAVYGLQNYFEIWPTGDAVYYGNFYSDINARWVPMEVATIAVGALALYFFPFPFLTAPIFFAAWSLSLDGIPALLGHELSWDSKCWISLFFGAALLLISMAIHMRKKRAYAFWGYLFGTAIFWGALNGLAWDKGELILFFYLLVNLALACLSIFLRTAILMVFGAIGTLLYMGHLAYTFFKDSFFFPLVAAAVGVGIIYLGILYQRHQRQIEEKLRCMLPSALRTLFDEPK